MNNEDTIVMQPKNEGASVNKKIEEASKTKEKDSNAKRAFVIATAGVFGGAVGGAGSVAAAHAINSMNDEEEVVAEVEPENDIVTETETASTKDTQEVTAEVEAEPDYTNHAGADPVAETPEPQDTSDSDNNDGGEVQVLGVYERYTEDGTHQEMAILTNGDEVAAVLDADGDGYADVIGIDMNHNGALEDGEILDISDQSVGMDRYENEYIAQQQAEQEQQDTFAYNADNQDDYNNDVEVYDA
ncbi:MAG: hypothetical protein IKQ72_07890 [Bacteroidaceae bacterium]|nr:hypothetical protein [Bacteroidaceae bacterium]